MNGNTIDVARVSEATHRDAAGRGDAHSIQSELNALRVAKETLVKKGREYDARLIGINNLLRRKKDYALQAERAKIVERKQLVMSEIGEINSRLRPLQQDEFREQGGTMSMALAELRREVMGMRTQIRELVALVNRLAR